MGFKRICAALAALSAVGGASAALAQGTNPPSYQQVAWGTTGCAVTYGDEVSAPDLGGFVDLAIATGAFGFTYDAKTQLGTLITAPFPAGCRPAASAKEALYLAQGPVMVYKEQTFGFNDCAVTFSDNIDDTDLGAMMEEARARGAVGFAIHPDGGLGAFIEGDYPFGCKPAKSLSWPLYLAEGWEAQYAKAAFGFNGCPISLGPDLEGMTRQGMNIAGTQWGAPGFAFQASGSVGALLRAPYQGGCESAPNMSWGLYFLQRP